jgi:hypothetical protein
MRSSLTKNKFILGVSLLALVLVLSVFVHAVLGMLIAIVRAPKEQAKLDRAIADIRRSGAPTDFSQLGGPPLPDAENAALVYARAFKAFNLSKDDNELMSMICTRPETMDDPEVRADLERVLEANKEPLALLNEAARMPRCRFSVNWDAEALAVEFPHQVHLRICGRLLAAQSLLLARENQGDAALEACEAALALAQAISTQPTLLAQYSSYGAIGMACRTLEPVLEWSLPSPAECLSLADRLASMDLNKPRVRAFEGERASGLSVFGMALNAFEPRAAVLAISKTLLEAEPNGRARRFTPPRTRSPLQSPEGRLVVLMDARAYLHLLNRAVELAPLPYRELPNHEPMPDDEAENLVRHRLARPWWAHLSPAPSPDYLLTFALTPGVASGGRSRDEALARAALAQTALWLRAYAATHTTYPDSLSALGKAIGKPLPTDPFSGKAFGYRRQGQGFLLYSWGPNLKDDGGIPPPTWPDTGDILFQCSRQPSRPSTMSSPGV